jgi:hypothetical protein
MATTNATSLLGAWRVEQRLAQRRPSDCERVD